MSEEGKCPISGNKSSSGGCPVGMGKKKPDGPTACPMQGDAGTNTTVGTTVGCPVSPSNIYKWFTGVDITRDVEPTAKPYKNPKQYNVYSVEIDPKNQMPVKSAQEPSEGQIQPLSIDRVKSNIPKAGAEENEDGSAATWQYPSPQMFWNSLVRKGKVEGAKEEDMETVVAVHNNMNEKTWDEVMKWENLKSNGAFIGGEAKLLRFMGKPYDLSPKARLKMIFGHPAPFDRHDWWVDQGGRINRYIIDYYHDESSSSQDNKPKQLKDFNSMKSIKVDVRPAMFDNFFGLYARLVVMPFKRLVGMTTFQPLPFFAPKSMIKGGADKASKIQANWAEIESRCSEIKARLASCEGDEECGAAAVSLQRCTASVICPSVVEEFDKCIKNKSDDEVISRSYSKMTDCLDDFEIECRSAK